MASARFLTGLNPEQQDACTRIQGPLLILAGAGSGKTTVLVSRTGLILEQNPRARVCVLTFTNKAASELKHRVGAKLGAVPKENLWAGTFHSFALRWLREHRELARLPAGFGVIDQGDSQSILRELLSHVRNAEKTQFDFDRILSTLNDWREAAAVAGRSDIVPENANFEDPYCTMAAVLGPKYLQRLDLLGVVDFTELLVRPVRLINETPETREQFSRLFDYVMVDEFQDTNELQLLMVEELARRTGNLAVVGDDDQSIYGWRGAQVKNILGFPQRHKDSAVVRLERNYRSTPAILHFANAVIANNPERHGKTLRAHSDGDAGDLPEFHAYETEEEECEGIISHVRDLMREGFSPSEIAVLYRSNGQGALIEADLRRDGIAYEMTGGQGFFDRREAKDTMAYLRCSLTPHELHFRRIVNTPPRGLGEATLKLWEDIAREKKVGLFVAARLWSGAGEEKKVGVVAPAQTSFFAPVEQSESLETRRSPREATRTLMAFFDGLAERLHQAAISGETSVGTRLTHLMSELGYKEFLKSVHKEPEAVERRWQGVEILGRVLDAFIERGRVRAKERGQSLQEVDWVYKTLHEFMDAMELRDAALPESQEEKSGKIQLMTLHASKGLEFDAVLFPGCEEDVIPHKTLGSDVSEERRLFYVGITRARRRLILSASRQRRRHGRLKPSVISRFVQEAPRHLLRRLDAGDSPRKSREALLQEFFSRFDGTPR